jgi:hypothetical protein
MEATVTVTVTVNLLKCPKNKRHRGLPLDIRLSRLHLELPYMQNALAHGTPANILHAKILYTSVFNKYPGPVKFAEC